MELQKVAYIPNNNYAVETIDRKAGSCLMWGAAIKQLEKGRK